MKSPSDTARTLADQQIVAALGVTPGFDAAAEIARRVDFLCTHLRAGGLRTLVLGISGGIDSATAGRLGQLCAERLRSTGYAARFVAMRLPYGVQRDEADAADAMLASLQAGGFSAADAAQQDFVLGNIKARQRMIAQYAVAGARAGLVIGTDHAAESLMGFFTKFGDGAADVLPLAGLNKRRVRALAQALGAPQRLVDKTPTADLETLRPLRADEDAYGVSYDEIDDFLEGKPVSETTRATILRFYTGTRHKRALPCTPQDPPPAA